MYTPKSAMYTPKSAMYTGKVVIMRWFDKVNA